MKKIIKLIISNLLVCLNCISQTNSEFGNWFYTGANNGDNMITKSHYGKSYPFPTTFIGRLNSANINLTTKEKSKLVQLVEILKAVNPNPHLYSHIFSVTPLGSSRLTQKEYDSRKYRFGYAIQVGSQAMSVKNSKIEDRWANIVNMDEGIKHKSEIAHITVNVNQIPKLYGGYMLGYEGPTINEEEYFTYIKKRRLDAQGKFLDTRENRFPLKNYVVSIESHEAAFANAQKLFSKNEMPTLQFGTYADNYITYRTYNNKSISMYGIDNLTLSNNKTTNDYKVHITNNMVILSYNNKLPLIPLTIEQYLKIVEDLCNEKIEDLKYYKNYNLADYEKNKKYNDGLEMKNIAQENATIQFINKLRDIYKNRLQDHAIVNLAYSNCFSSGYTTFIVENCIRSQRTNKAEPIGSNLYDNFFVTTPKEGKAYYLNDFEFYKNMADGEIRTICILWNEETRMIENRDFKKPNSILTDRTSVTFFADNPDSYIHNFNKKMDWKKLATLLGK